MIVILSDKKDTSTNNVIDWICHYGENYFLINSIIDLETFITRHSVLKIDKETERELKNNKALSVWYRRSPSLNLPTTIVGKMNTDRCIRKFVFSEQKGLFEAFYAAMKNYKWLNRWSNSSPGKFHQLTLAVKVGLNIPSTCILNSKEQLVSFMNDKGRIIVKPIQDIEPIELDGDYYFQYTKALYLKDMDKLNSTFFPSLFQKEIKKNMEIRTFYINKHFYSMGICSSFDEQTSEDFRRYNDTYPNRVVPYNLPTELEDKLCALMYELDLNCGSIDLILDDYGEYYFLEVNPVGQFGMVSYPCNYYLEREIAKFLTDEQPT